MAEEWKAAFGDLTAMISSERDARRADVLDIRAHLAAIDRRLVDADERASRVDSAMLDALGKMAAKLDTVDQRVTELETWRKGQAS